MALRPAWRDGTWATAPRLRAYRLIMLAVSLVSLVALLATSDGMRDAVRRPLGTDFSQVWVAGRQVLAGRPTAPFDPATHAAAQRGFFGAATPFYGWHYPPYFLVVAEILARVPYAGALALWQAATFGLYLACVWAILRRQWRSRWDILLSAAAFPAVFVNLTHGHNGFLTAALMSFGLLALPMRPVLAGVCFGLLAYKPQFGLVLPFALVAVGAWRTIAAALATLMLMTLATIAAYGTATWQAFFASLAFTRQVVLEQGATGWEKIQSPFAAARMLGAGIDLAYAVQGLVTVSALLAVALVWHSRADPRLKAALLMTASLLTTPYCLDYDMMLLGPALAFSVSLAMEEGWRPWEKTAFAAVWAVPAFARVVGGVAHVPLGLPIMLVFFVLLLRRVAGTIPEPQKDVATGLLAGRWVPAPKRITDPA